MVEEERTRNEVSPSWVASGTKYRKAKFQPNGEDHELILLLQPIVTVHMVEIVSDIAS